MTMSKKGKKAVNGVVYEFTNNKNGVMIKKCCASCKHHEPYDSEGPRRMCTLSQKIVDKSECCGDWCISKEIDDIKLR